MKIGYVRDTYAERRLFIDKVDDATYVKLENELTNDANRLSASEFEWSALVDDNSSIDLVHFFNQVNYGNAPWVVTFETTAPRLYSAENYESGVETLASENCKALIAMSECAMEIHRRDLKAKAPKYFDALNRKSLVLHPPQDLINANLARFNNIKHLKVVFVSNQFFLKGGLPMIEALIDIRRTMDLELNLVTRFSLNDNVTMHSTDDVYKVRELISRNSEWINLHNGMPNNKVLELMSECHLGICLSFAETYGYVVLEMQAAGVPVVTTDIRAFPEINSNEIGWMLGYPYRYGRLPSNASKQTVDQISLSLKEQLLRVLDSINRNGGELLKTKATLAREKIRRMHDPISYGRKLNEIYENGLVSV